MSLEDLPPVIKNHLMKLMQENQFNPSKSQVVITEITIGEIGSSCSVTIKENNSELHLFIKFLIEDSNFSSQAAQYFNNETIFYGEILEQFCELEEELTCVPRCYGVGVDVPFIMMKDLTGYAPCESLSDLDLVKLILEELGRFHAYSFAVKNQFPQMFHGATSRLKETLLQPQASCRKIFVHAIHDAYKLLKRSLPEDSIYVECFANFVLDIYDKLYLLSQEDEDYKVLTHGDLWPNNILWNSSSNSIMFIDFQGCRYSSPVHDLMLILLTGLDKKFRNTHQTQFIKFYHNALCEQLIKLKLEPLKIFPFSALQSQIVKHSKFALAIALVGLPIYYNENNEVIVAANVEGYDKIYHFLDEIRRKKSLKCKCKMLEIIMDCVDQGFIN